ncbi:MAG TPA: sulfatase-like hydrolase/transferase [Acidimicrobiia bacterium]|nr:sulfatase-like hydrolase/transferase [Acidimicrobiia bacterium]
MKNDSSQIERPTRPVAENVRAENRLMFVDYLLLICASFIGPLSQMAPNYWQLVHPERAFLLGFLIAGLACGAAYLIAGRTRRRMRPVFPVLVAVLVLTKGGRLLLQYPAVLGWFLAGLAIVVAWYLGNRLSEGVLQVVSVVAVVTLGSGLIVDWYRTSSEMGPSQVVRQDLIGADLTERPDIYLVVLDGYMGLQGQQGVFGESKGDVVSQLEDLGFHVPRSAWSGYSTTERSIPSIFEMGYPVGSEEPNEGTSRDLHRMIAGWNNTIDVLRSNGYHSTMIESGWVGSGCSSAYDSCVQSHWLDSLMFSIAWDSLANKSVATAYGHPFTVNSLHTMSSVEDLQAQYRDNNRPDFVFAHVLAPHPPFYLDAQCQVVASDSRFDLSFAEEAVVPARDDLFAEQAACVDEFMLDLASTAGEGDVVILTADHGMRRHHEPEPSGRPSDETLLELMNVFVAVRANPGCGLTDPMVTPDLMRQIFSCYAAEPLDPVPQRMFVDGGYELSRAEITELTASG